MNQTDIAHEIFDRHLMAHANGHRVQVREATILACACGFVAHTANQAHVVEAMDAHFKFVLRHRAA